MAIQSVIFDFGGVLSFAPNGQQIAAAADACEVAVPDFLRAFWANRLVYDRGQDSQEYWLEVGNILGRAFDATLIARMIQFEIGFWSAHDARVLAWTKQLRSGGVRTGILSNIPRPLGENLRTTPGFLDHFDHVTFSYELRTVKPEAGTYEHAIRGLGVAPEQALFLDDRQENVEGALAVGLRAELFVSWEQFIETAPARYGLPVPPPVPEVARRQ